MEDNLQKMRMLMDHIPFTLSNASYLRLSSRNSPNAMLINSARQARNDYQLAGRESYCRLSNCILILVQAALRSREFTRGAMLPRESGKLYMNLASSKYSLFANDMDKDMISRMRGFSLRDKSTASLGLGFSLFDGCISR